MIIIFVCGLLFVCEVNRRTDINNFYNVERHNLLLKQHAVVITIEKCNFQILFIFLMCSEPLMVQSQSNSSDNQKREKWLT